MQHRMKTHQLAPSQIEALLDKQGVGVLATVNADGTPYVTPIHFVHHKGAVYFHGLPAGQKLDNLDRDNRVGFTVYRMDGLLLDEHENPCDTNTGYESVIISGRASRVDDPERKSEILATVVRKYTPHLLGREIPAAMVKGTAVVEVVVDTVSGKYWA